jgi:hypothetical protein
MRLAAFWDGVLPLIDPFSALYQSCWECAYSKDIGEITFTAETTLATPFIVAGAARAGVAPSLLGPQGSLLGRAAGLLNRNDYLGAVNK